MEINQPITHTILRNSQVRKKQTVRQGNGIPLSNSNIPSYNNKNPSYIYQQANPTSQSPLYSFINYQQSNNLPQTKQAIPTTNLQSKYNQTTKYSQNPSRYHYDYNKAQNQEKYQRLNKSNVFINHQPQNSNNINRINRQKQKFVVCNSLPHTKPKYSFTFGQVPSISTIMNRTSKNQYNPQYPNKQAKNQYKYKLDSSRKIRTQLDFCLYTMSDKLKQLKNKQNQALLPQNNNLKPQPQQEPIKSDSHHQQSQQNIELEKSQYHYQNEKQKYRPSLTQLRKNNKLYLDRSIHRIEPEIIDQYMQTVYKEYDIPDIMESNPQSNKQIKTLNNMDDRSVKIKATQNSNSFKQSKIAEQTIDQNQRVTFIDPETSNNKPQTSKNNNFYLGGDKILRRNTRFQNEKQMNKGKANKRRFLDITLSKQKYIKNKKFQSPNKKQQKQQQKQKQESRSRSRSASRQNSQSQKKIRDLKNNISNFKQNEQILAERYSYLQSPYQILKNQTQIIAKAGYKIQSNRGYKIESNTSINVKVRPFQQLMSIKLPVIQSSYQPHYQNPQNNPNSMTKNSTIIHPTHNTSYINQHSTINKNTTQLSQYIDSKYNKSFITQTGQVIEQFRYCFLCELPILSANLYRHQHKCIGWICRHKLYTFKYLYEIEKEEELIGLIKEKISQIRMRICRNVEIIQQKQKEEAGYNQRVNGNILKSVENYVKNRFFFDKEAKQNQMRESKQPSGFYNNKDALNYNFKQIQKAYKTDHWVLVDQSYKLHWFIKILENYELNIRRMSTSVNIKNVKNSFSSTRQKNNISQTFVEQDSTHHIFSQFPSQKIQFK